MKKKPFATLKIGWTLSLAAAILAIPLVVAMCIPPISVSTSVYALVFLACLRPWDMQLITLPLSASP